LGRRIFQLRMENDDELLLLFVDEEDKVSNGCPAGKIRTSEMLVVCSLLSIAVDLRVPVGNDSGDTRLRGWKARQWLVIEMQVDSNRIFFFIFCGFVISCAVMA
jgi:hypothetical protein